jgi:hypothetical protein
VDPPPKLVLPIPLEIIQHALEMMYTDPHSSLALWAAADQITTAFFFLMQNSKYCHISDQDGYHPFWFCNITFYINNRALHNIQASKEELMATTRVSIKFNRQKNSHWGEEITQSPSGHITFCPCQALA